MLQSPVLYYAANPSPVSFWQDIEDFFSSRQCTHYVRQVLQQGIIAADDLEQAVTRAISACALAGLPVHRHFQPIYVCAGEIHKDWLVSDLAFQLIVLNAIARIQVELLSNHSSAGSVLR